MCCDNRTTGTGDESNRAQVDARPGGERPLKGHGTSASDHAGIDRELVAEIVALVASQLDVSSVFVAQGTAHPVRFQIVLTHQASDEAGAVAAAEAPRSILLDVQSEPEAAAFVVEDAGADERSAARALVEAFPDHQSFLVVPIPEPSGEIAGLLGASHDQPRTFTAAQRDLMLRAARLIRIQRLADPVPPESDSDGSPSGDTTGVAVSERMVATVARVLRSGQPETIRLGLAEVPDRRNYEIRMLVNGSSEAVTVVRGAMPENEVDAALRAEPNLLQTVIDLLPEQIYVKDASSRFTRVNQAVINDFGVPDGSAFIGKTDFDLFPEPVARAFFEQERALLETGVPIIGLLERQPKVNQPDNWRQTFKIPIRDATGKIVGLVGSSWDVTAALEHQRALEQLAALVQWSNDAIIGIDNEGRILSWNPAAERLFGYTADEIVGQPYVLLVPPGERMILADELAQWGPHEYAGSLESRRRRKDGTTVEVEVKAALMRDELGDPAGVSTIIREIGERKEAERQLQELERRYRTFVERMPAITYILAPGGAWTETPMLHLNERIEELTGYASQHWLDDSTFTFKIMHPDDRTRVIAIDQATTANGEPYSAEYRIVTADGRTVWFRDEAVLVHDEHGEPMYWLGFVLDISDQKRAEAELTEALAGQRTANRELERMGRAKSEIVSMISHEFRTPLTSIQGFSELLVDETLTRDEIRDFATTINGNARRLARMISDVLDLERLESGRTDVRRLPVDVAEIIDDVLESLQPTTTAHRFDVRLEPNLHWVLSDADLLTQVFTNLVGNAIKYSPAGGTITIESTHTPTTIKLTLRDEGVGIPEDALETIFGRYTRLERPEQHHIEGTGLGLPIARQIVEMLGGRVWAERPADGAGAVFQVELPARRPEADGSPAPPSWRSHQPTSEERDPGNG